MIEQLERRCLLSASLVDGWLTIRAGSWADSIDIKRDGANLVATVNNTAYRYLLQNVQLAVIYGGIGDDRIDVRSSPVPCFVRGEKGNDTITGSANADTLIGGEGNDSIMGGLGGDLLVGQNGNDTLKGGAGDDSLFGCRGNDALFGEANGDFLVGGLGRDFVYGGLGNDILSENDDNWGHAWYESGVQASIDISSLALASDEFRLFPTAGGDGSDSLSGGSGIDTVTYSRRQERLTISLDCKANDGASREHDNVFMDVENITGGVRSDLIIGDDDNNLLRAGLPSPTNPNTASVSEPSDFGDDTIYGMGGSDTLYGGNGNDELRGGEGDDTLEGDKGSGCFYGDAGHDYARVDGSEIRTVVDVEYLQEFFIHIPDGPPWL